MSSNCCGAPVYDNSDICMACKEHCEDVPEEHEEGVKGSWVEVESKDNVPTYKFAEV